ncbi:protein notum-like protein [Dinothrombium tinctorium]|uniref:Protein notum-like protein n=1 Tax=Dinothrombium tinctorium TaxID=1965070 RepID=A0A443RMB5_9ACAR|nr:protein notum-like protein [Dinothrombium tinctorium]
MDAIAILLLIVMAIVINSTSGRFETEPASTTGSSLTDDSMSQTLTASSKQLPPHISNQHRLLRKLSQAFEGSQKRKDIGSSSIATDYDPEDNEYNNHHRQAHNLHSNSNNHRIHSNSGGDLRRVMLRNTSVTCNDGTTAGYYIRQSHGSKRWIVFLEGGWYCFSANTCHQRWLRMRNLMSSAHWPEVRNVGGILSTEPDENPFWWNANHVFVPYCSSDSWSGDSMAKSPREFSFLGSRIVEHVILELLPRGLYDAKSLLLAGSSAGAGGVLVNLDRVADLLAAIGSKVEVRGLSDSGWFLDNEPFDFHTAMAIKSSSKLVSSSAPHSLPFTKKASKACLDTYNCAPVEMVKQGIKLWNGQVPSACKARYDAEPWRCYFGYRVYQTLRTPLFVVQWLFDEAQMTADNVATPISKAQWNYIHKMGQELRKTLENVTAVFAPSCISHIILTKRDWNRIKINGVSLPQTLRCWELQGSERTHQEYDLMFTTHKRNKQQMHNQQPAESGNESDLLADSPSHHLTKSPHNNRGITSSSSPLKPADHTNVHLVERIRRKKRKRKHRRRHQQHSSLRNKRSSKDGRWNSERQQWFIQRDVCNHFLIDSCSWPQCNRGCPKLHNPFTGEEVDFKELLKSFGFDMSSVANAFGVDEKTLNEMDQETLFQLLTQR